MIGRAPGLQPEDLAPDDVPEGALWLEDAVRAALGTAPAEPSDLERALGSNLLRGFLGWPEPKEMGGFTVLSPRTPEQVLAVRRDTRELLLHVVNDGFAPYRRKRFAVLALCNLYALGVGSADTLKHLDQLQWLVPPLREYLRDALAGTGALSLGPAAFDRNRAVEEAIVAAHAPVDEGRAEAYSSPAPTLLRPADVAPTASEAHEASAVSKVRPCDAKALAQYKRALELRPDLPTARSSMKAIYAVVRELVHDPAEDGKLQPLDTWRRYVNRALHDPAAPKRSPTAGRQGRSVVRRDEL